MKVVYIFSTQGYSVTYKLVYGAVTGCLPGVYAALSGNMPDQDITL